MRRAWPVLGLFVALRVAAADDYPVEYVDRPLLLFDGMTEVEANGVVERRYYDTVDASGNSMTTVTGAVVGTGGSMRHQLGAFELGAGGSTIVHGDNTQDYAAVGAHVRYALGSLRHAVSLFASYEPPQQTLHHYYSVSASFDAKERAPKRKFALFWYAGATAFKKGDDAVATSYCAELYAGGTAELQCSHHLALTVGLGLGVPFKRCLVDAGPTPSSERFGYQVTRRARERETMIPPNRGDAGRARYLGRV